MPPDPLAGSRIRRIAIRTPPHNFLATGMFFAVHSRLVYVRAGHISVGLVVTTGAKRLYVPDGTQNQYGWRQRVRFSISIFAGIYFHL